VKDVVRWPHSGCKCARPVLMKAQCSSFKPAPELPVPSTSFPTSCAGDAQCLLGNNSCSSSMMMCISDPQLSMLRPDPTLGFALGLPTSMLLAEPACQRRHACGIAPPATSGVRPPATKMNGRQAISRDRSSGGGRHMRLLGCCCGRASHDCHSACWLHAPTMARPDPTRPDPGLDGPVCPLRSVLRSAERVRLCRVESSRAVSGSTSSFSEGRVGAPSGDPLPPCPTGGRSSSVLACFQGLR
jgi:hypothetical protein